MLEAEGKLREAEKNYASTVNIYKSQVDADPKNERHKMSLLWGHYYLSHVQIEREQYDEAIATLEPALKLVRQLVEEDKTKTNAVLRRQYARLLLLSGKLDLLTRKPQEASERFTEASQITGPMLEEAADDLYALELHANALIGLGQVSGRTGNAVDAKRWFDEGIEALRTLKDSAPHDQHYRTVLGEGLLEAGNWALDKREYVLAQDYLADATKAFGDLLSSAPRIFAARRGLASSLASEAQLRQASAKRAKGAEKQELLGSSCAAYKESARQLSSLGKEGMLSSEMKEVEKVVEKGEKKACR